MKILVLGAGGREHAILWSLKRTSATPLQLFCAPGNAGIAELARCLPLNPGDHASVLQFVHSESIDLTVIGPEAPLAAGIVDQFERCRFPIIGPNHSAARLESSKVFAKEFMARHEIPTAGYRVANTISEAVEILREGEFGPADAAVVMKADGLAGGKGVIVATSRAEAEGAVAELMSGYVVAKDAAKSVVIEEALKGIEASLLIFADGRDYALMPAARDHKRIAEGDKGPNTGGMGAVTDGTILDPATLERIVRKIIEPTLAGALEEGFPYRGVLFIGLMLTDDGPKVLEYNVRFGDPETQAILIRLQTDLLEVFQAIRHGRLGRTTVEWSSESSACVVLASSGYPGTYEKGAAIRGLESLKSLEKLQVFHAGTRLSERGEFLTDGGRVLGVTATGNTLEQALARSYSAVDKINWEGMQYRRDIGRFPGVLRVSQS
jgi:phosphoribosylamine---glycine ligase